MDLVRRLHAKALITICLLSCALRAGAQQAADAVPANSFEGRQVGRITFEPVDQPLSPADFEALIPFKPGQPFHAADTRVAIDKLYATGRYDDVQIDVEPAASGGIDVRFITVNSWFFGHVGIEGDVSGPPNTGQMLSVANIGLGQPFDQNQVTDAEERIRRLLISNGYFVPVVSHSLEYDKTYQQVRVTFAVKVAKRAHYAPPVITGDTSVLSANAIVKATQWRRFLMPGFRGIEQTRTRTGIDKIRLTYQKSNHLLATVTFNGIAPDTEIPANRNPPGIASIAVNPGPVVAVRATGAKVSQKTLQQYLPIYEEGTVDADLLAEGVTNLRDYFQQQGYFEVTVDFSQQKVVDGKTDIDYEVNLGIRHRLVSVTVSGNKFFDTKTIRERMAVLPRSFEIRRGRYSEALAARDKSVIEDLYHSNGFRDAHVTTETQDDYKNVKGDIAVSFKIDEGQLYTVASLTITGVEQPELGKISEHLSSKEGEPFSEYDVTADKETILDELGAAGYTNASFVWAWAPGTKPFTADIKFVISEGEPQFIRELVVTGLSTTRRSLVEKQLHEKTGDPLSATSMAETQRSLYDLAIFSQVNMAVQNPDGDEERRTVLYDLQEASRYSITTGLGTEFGRIGGGTPAQDLSNPGGATTLTPRASLGLTRLNLFGLGQSIGLQIVLSTVQKRSSLNYFVPRIFSRPSMNGNFTVLYDDTSDVDTFRAIRREVSSQISQKLSKTINTFYRFAYRDVGVSNLKISPLLVPRLAQSVRVGIASFNIVHDRRDDPVDPHKGIYSTLDLGLATRYFGSQTSFVRILGRNATYYSLGPKFVLARETQFGIEPAFRVPADADPSDPIPLPERFYGGGGSTMRGYPQNQAGPRDGSTGFPLGGSALFFNSTEIRFPLYGANIRGVLFEDFGNVFSTIGNISFRTDQRGIGDFNFMSHAVGFGIRYRTPLGPLRLDVAYDINPPQYNGFAGDYTQLVQCSASGTCSTSTQHISHFQFFFSIGQAF